jgi:hypothetical protein
VEFVCSLLHRLMCVKDVRSGLREMLFGGELSWTRTRDKSHYPCLDA